MYLVMLIIFLTFATNQKNVNNMSRYVIRDDEPDGSTLFWVIVFLGLLFLFIKGLKEDFWGTLHFVFVQIPIDIFSGLWEIISSILGSSSVPKISKISPLLGLIFKIVLEGRVLRDFWDALILYTTSLGIDTAMQSNLYFSK